MNIVTATNTPRYDYQYKLSLIPWLLVNPVKIQLLGLKMNETKL